MALFSSVKDGLDTGNCYCQNRGNLEEKKDAKDTPSCYCQNRGIAEEKKDAKDTPSCYCQNRGGFGEKKDAKDTSACYCQNRGIADTNNLKFKPNLNENYAPDIKDKVNELYAEELGNENGSCDVVVRETVVSCDVVVRDCDCKNDDCDCKNGGCDVVVRDCDVVMRDCDCKKEECKCGKDISSENIPSNQNTDLNEIFSAILSSLIRIEEALNLNK